MAEDNTDSLTSEPIDLVPDRFIRTDRVRRNTGGEQPWARHGGERSDRRPPRKLLSPVILGRFLFPSAPL